MQFDVILRILFEFRKLKFWKISSISKAQRKITETSFFISSLVIESIAKSSIKKKNKYK